MIFFFMSYSTHLVIWHLYQQNINFLFFFFFCLFHRVVSGSRDATLRVWDIVQGKCLHTLVGHLAAVRCVQYDGKLVVSGAYDYMVKVWNPETEECLHTLQGHTNRVYSLQVNTLYINSQSLFLRFIEWNSQ